MNRVAAVPKILFGFKPEWERQIRSNIDAGFALSFDRFSRHRFAEHDVIVPLMIEDYAPLWSHRDEVSGRALFPPQQAVALCHDKKAFNERIAERVAGDVIPHMYKAGDRLDFPLIAKKRRGAWGIGSKVLRDPATAEEARRDDTLFLQELIVGDQEHATHLLVRDFEIIYHLHLTYTMDGDCVVKGRDASARASRLSKDCEHLDLFGAILRDVGFSDGTCCFDYKLSGSGVKIFEMNPRYGGTLTCDINGYLRALCGSLGVPLG